MASILLTFSSLFSIAFAITVSILSLSASSLKNGGFSVELIHRDSAKSPFYNPFLTPSQRVINALRRSVNRVRHFEARSVSPNGPSSEVIYGHGEYLMKMSIGTPPFEILAIVDTGSDIIWTQCVPCTSCFQQSSPLFDPRNSSTYKDVSCDSQQCLSLPITHCSGSCQYAVGYGDQSFSSGALATETVTFGSNTGQPVSLPQTIFGCAHYDGGRFSENASGIIGLGGGQVSLISQMGSSIGGKFSYCLMPFSFTSSNSTMNFGHNGVVSGDGVVSTPIVPKSPDTFYYLTLEGISVGGERLDFYNSSSPSDDSDQERGNIIIDSGTTMTLLPTDLYNRLESTVRKAIPRSPVTDPFLTLHLCYSNTGAIFDVPIMTVHFEGADVKLKRENTFVETSGVICLAFIPSSGLAIYGNLAQMNFLVGFDLQKKTVSFKPTDCAQ